jgi:DNA gyrase subunit A
LPPNAPKERLETLRKAFAATLRDPEFLTEAKKTKLSAYSHPRSVGVTAIKLDPNDSLIEAALTTGKDHIMLGTRDGMAIRFDEQQVRSMGRVSRGVHGIKLRSGDAVVDMVIAEEGASLLRYAKRLRQRTSLDNYRHKTIGVGLIILKPPNETSAQGGAIRR